MEWAGSNSIVTSISRSTVGSTPRIMPINSPIAPPTARPVNAVASVSRVVVMIDPSATAEKNATTIALGGASESMSVRFAMRPAISPATINTAGSASPFQVSDEINACPRSS